MNLLQLVDEKQQKLKQLENLKNVASKQKRKLNDEEFKQYNSLTEDIEKLNIKITNIRNVSSKKQPKEEMNLNFVEQIRNAQNGEKIKFEKRATITAADANSGADFIATNVTSFVEPLRNSLIFKKLGATYLTGIKGNGDIKVPVYAGSTAALKGENVTATDGAGATSNITLSPKRITAYIDISNEFLTQNSPDVEAMLINDLVNAVKEKFENITLTSLFEGASLVNYGASSWSNVVDLESAITANNVNVATAAYVTSAKGAGKLKSKAKSTNAGIFILEKGEMNGYPVAVTNNVIDTISGLTANLTGGTESGIIFGDWSQLVVAIWNDGSEIIVDKLTQAHLGKTRLVVNAYMDAKKRISGAFAVGSILS